MDANIRTGINIIVRIAFREPAKGIAPTSFSARTGGNGKQIPKQTPTSDWSVVLGGIRVDYSFAFLVTILVDNLVRKHGMVLSSTDKRVSTVENPVLLDPLLDQKGKIIVVGSAFIVDALTI